MCRQGSFTRCVTPAYTRPLSPPSRSLDTNPRCCWLKAHTSSLISGYWYNWYWIPTQGSTGIRHRRIPGEYQAAPGGPRTLQTINYHYTRLHFHSTSIQDRHRLEMLAAKGIHPVKHLQASPPLPPHTLPGIGHPLKLLLAQGETGSCTHLQRCWPEAHTPARIQAQHLQASHPTHALCKTH